MSDGFRPVVNHHGTLVDVQRLTAHNGLDSESFGPRSLFTDPVARLADLGRILGVGSVPKAVETSASEEDLSAPLPYPGKIICVGMNYARHAEESGSPLPETPVIFSKLSNTIVGPRDTVVLPSFVEDGDYEVELAVVMGKRAKNVAAPDALDYVLGYATANDLSARSLQQATTQWLLGKSLDGFLPLGPYVVTRDEIDDPQGLRLRSWVDDEPRQDSSTADMIFDVADIIEFLSRYLTLEPGDLLLTGTPEGVAIGGRYPWLSRGDVVAVEVEGLGSCVNELVGW